MYFATIQISIKIKNSIVKIFIGVIRLDIVTAKEVLSRGE